MTTLDDGVRHGTLTAIKKHRCDCAVCKEANAAYMRRYRADRRAGVNNRLVPAGPTRERIHLLVSMGMSIQSIADRSGYAVSVIARLHSPTRKYANRDRVTAALADAVAGVRLPRRGEGGGTRVDAGPTRERLRALHRIGWTTRRLAQHVGIPAANLFRVEQGNAFLTARLRDQVLDMFDELGDTPPQPRSRQDRTVIEGTRQAAAAAGWPTPAELRERLVDVPVLARTA